MGIEGFLSFEDSIDLVEQLVHDGSDDLHFLFALGGQAFGHGFANGVVTHGCHGREEQVSAQVLAAGFGHGSVRFAARSGLKLAGRYAGIGAELACTGKVFKIG